LEGVEFCAHEATLHDKTKIKSKLRIRLF